MHKTDKFKELNEKLKVKNQELKRIEDMLGMAVAKTKGNMNKDVKKGDIIDLKVLVPIGENTEFEVIKKTPTGQLDVKSTTNARKIIRVTFDIEAHAPLYDIVYEMMELYAELEKEREFMEANSINFKDFLK